MENKINVCIQVENINRAKELKESIEYFLSDGSYENSYVSIQAIPANTRETKTIEQLKEEYRQYLADVADDENFDITTVGNWNTWFEHEEARLLNEENVEVTP